MAATQPAATPPVTAPPPETARELEEVIRLRAEVAGLRARLATADPTAHRKPVGGIIDSETEDQLRDAVRHGSRQGDRLGEGLAAALIEAVRVQADSLAAAADTLFDTRQRRRRHRRTGADESAPDRKPDDSRGQAPIGIADVAAALAVAIDKGADGTSRVVRRFVDTYERTERRR